LSLLISNCHGYRALGISGIPASPTKAWLLAWVWVPSSYGTANRGLVQLTASTLDGTKDYVGLEFDGSIVLIGACRTGNTRQVTPDPGNFYFFNSPQQTKWTIGCTVIDLSQSAADTKVIYGRYSSTAVPATTQADTDDLSAFSDSLVDLYVGRQANAVRTGSASDGTDTIKLAEIALGFGSVPSSSDIQACIDGQSPGDLAGVFEHWRLRDSGDGLVGLLQGITLAPFGGAATTTWDGADNPTVNGPTGGGGGGSAIAAISNYYRMMRSA
jgi:hypothetical protein